VQYFTDSVEWQQKVAASLSDSFLVKGNISYMYQKGAEYLPAETEFKIFVLPDASTVAAQTEGPQLKAANTGGSVATRSLTWIFFTAFAGGLLALITPCVYSMIPVTVSFFT
jgi:thiol:disulfide interchange protein DsbD